MHRNPRLQRLFLIVAAGGIAFYGALHGRDTIAQAAPASAKNAVANGMASGARESTKNSVALLPPVREKIDEDTGKNLFAPVSWLPPAPPPPPQKVVAAPPPQAPPLPFRFVGMLEDATRPSAFLARGEALLIVQAGDTVDASYRVDAVSPTEIALTYLPLNQRQRIRISGEL